MSHERLIDKRAPPSDEDMTNVIGQSLASAWTDLRRFLLETYDIVPFLQYGGKRYGWNLQHRKGGRPLCELYPDFRHQGIGKAVVDAVEKEIRKDAQTTVILSGVQVNNPQARSWRSVPAMTQIQV
jgi:hypothetical protein